MTTKEWTKETPLWWFDTGLLDFRECRLERVNSDGSYVINRGERMMPVTVRPDDSDVISHGVSGNDDLYHINMWYLSADKEAIKAKFMYDQEVLMCGIRNMTFKF